MPTKSPPNPSDEQFLDAVYARIFEQVEDGHRPLLEDFLSDRPHLKAEISKLIEIALEIAIAPSNHRPDLADFEIVSELGRGGMGAVYLARQLRAGGRLVALKILQQHAVPSEKARDRFVHEANTLAKLRHPNIVTLHDVILDHGVSAYAMEWIDGKPLSQLIERLRSFNNPTSQKGGTDSVSSDKSKSVRTPMNNVADFLGASADAIRESSYTIFICRILISIARALAEVHRLGLTHRDVKPSNILLRRDGTALLTDFGLVRQPDSAVVTQTGHFIGTLAYASPEQLHGDHSSVGPCSDGYSLGVTLYHALTLQLPFTGQSPAELLTQIEGGRSASLRCLCRDLPRDLETIVTKAMDPEPSRRYATADDLADDLDRLLNLQPIKAKPATLVTRAMKAARRNRGHLVAAIVGGVFALALVSVAAMYWLVLPRWSNQSLTQARLALLHPDQGNAMFNAEFFGVEPSALRLSIRPDGLRSALAQYDAALRWQPFDHAVRREREVVRLALSKATASQEFGGKKVEGVTPRSEIPALRSSSVPGGQTTGSSSLSLGEPIASSTDLRSTGLYAYLIGDAATAIDAWTKLDLQSEPDAFINAALGQLYIARGEHSRAYPRLSKAVEAFPNVSFLTQYLADAAVQSGDLEKAQQWLDLARTQPMQDRYLGLDRVQADLFAAEGRDDEAVVLYQTVSRGSQVAIFNYGLLLESRGRLREALFVLQDAVRSAPNSVRAREAFGRTLERWWDSLLYSQRRAEVRSALDRGSDGPLTAWVIAYTSAMERHSDKSDSSRFSPTLPRHPSASYLQRDAVSLATLARRMEVENVERWNYLRRLPSIMKDWLAESWLSPRPTLKGRFAEWCADAMIAVDNVPLIIRRAVAPLSLGTSASVQPVRTRSLTLPAVIGVTMVAGITSANPTVPPGFCIETYLEDVSPQLIEMEVAPPTFGSYGGQLFYSDRDGGDFIFRVDESGQPQLFATVPSLVSFLKFGPGGAWGTDLYAIVNCEDGSCAGPGRIYRITSSGTVSVFGNPTPLGGYLFGGSDLAFSESGPFGTYLYSGTTGGFPGDCISRVGPAGGQASLFYNIAGFEPPPLFAGGPAQMEFGSGLDGFTTNLYVNIASSGSDPSLASIDGIVMLDATASLTPFFTRATTGLDVLDFTFGPGGAFGHDIYATDGTRILRVNSSSSYEEFGSGFAPQRLTFDGSDALYVLDYEAHRIYRITPSPALATIGFTGLGDLPGGVIESYATGLSADGTTVVGQSDSNNGTEGFRWRAGSMTGLGDLPGNGFYSSAVNCSGDGEIVVGQSLSGNSNSGFPAEAYYWTQGSGMVGMGSLPGVQNYSAAYDISDDGSVICGTSVLDCPGNGDGFLWTSGGGMVSINLPYDSTIYTMSADGNVLGGAAFPLICPTPFQIPLRWEAGIGQQLDDLAGGIFDGAIYNLSADGSIAIGRGTSPSGGEAALWPEGQNTPIGLGDLAGGSFHSKAYGISADGSLIVGLGTSSQGEEAVLWDESLTIHRLTDILAGNGIAVPCGWHLRYATRIMVNCGVITIVGTGTNTDGNTEAWIASYIPGSPPVVPFACDDGDACTINDSCEFGPCTGTPINVAVACNDNNPCTTDSCNPASGCVNTNNTIACTDNNACTVGDVCSGGACVPGAAANCNDNNDCTNDGCNPATGCNHANNANICNDDNSCTTNDVCAGGNCAGTPPRPWGDITPIDCDPPIAGCNVVDLDDILCVLNAFAGNYTCAGGLANADIVPCVGNSVINLDDILGVLNAFSGANQCPCVP